MNLNELKERFQSELKVSIEKLQESNLYIQLKEKYDDLTPSMQKVVLWGSAAFFLYAFVSIPGDKYSNSQILVEEFESRRDLIRQMMKVHREASSSFDIPVAPDIQSLKSRIERDLRNARLLPDQILSVEPVLANSRLVPENLLSGQLDVKLTKLNIRQVVDLGFQIQSISPSVKLKDLSITAHPELKDYFDVSYSIITLSVPQNPGADNSASDKGR
jgi:hypothetical protein